MKNNLVSIIIPTHNRKKMVSRLLVSILKNKYNPLEIIIIDDASSDGTYDYLKKNFNQKNISLIKNKNNLFTAGSRNVGIKKSKGIYLFFVDDDNVLDKDTVVRLTEVLDKDDSIGEVGPVNYNIHDKNKILWFFTKRNMFSTKTYQPRKNLFRKEMWETDDVPNAFMVRSKIIKKNKILFNEEFGIMYEESDFAYRIKNLGYKIMVVKKAKIFPDIENTFVKGKKMDYMFHFMEDKRRPYVTARNRIIFHSIYSNKFQLLFIISLWIWVFMVYYFYKILFYSGVGNFSIKRRLLLCFSYFKGIVDGLYALPKHLT